MCWSAEAGTQKKQEEAGVQGEIGYYVQGRQQPSELKVHWGPSAPFRTSTG